MRGTTYYQVTYLKIFLEFCNTKLSWKKNNLSLPEFKALMGIEENMNTIIQQADKGGDLVIQGKEDYLKKIYCLL